MKRNIIMAVAVLAVLSGLVWYVTVSRTGSPDAGRESTMSGAESTGTASSATGEPAATPGDVAPAAEAKTTGSGTVVSKARIARPKTRQALVTGVTGGNASVGMSSSGYTTHLSTAAGTGPESFEGAVVVGQLGAFGADTRSFTEMAVELGYRSGKHRFAILQQARKLYLIAPQGENEFVAADMVLWHEYELAPNILSFQVRSVLGATLPVSALSRRVKHVTRPTVGIVASRELFDGLVTVEWAPTFHYFLNQYATDPNRVPLRRMALGQQGELGLNLGSRARLAGWAKWLHAMYQEYDDSTNTPGATDSVEYGTYLGYRISRYFTAEAGYVRGSSLVRSALLDAPFYDPHTSRVYGSVTLSF